MARITQNESECVTKLVWLGGKKKTHGSGDSCVFSNVRSAILSAHYGDDGRQGAVRQPRQTVH
jgi:hypothetical protein